MANRISALLAAVLALAACAACAGPNMAAVDARYHAAEAENDARFNARMNEIYNSGPAGRAAVMDYANGCTNRTFVLDGVPHSVKTCTSR